MNRGLWKGLLIACGLMLAVLGASALEVEPGTPTYGAIQIAAVHLVVAMLIISGFLYFEWNPISNIFQ
jgi:hypothetical protein